MMSTAALLAAKMDTVFATIGGSAQASSSTLMPVSCSKALAFCTVAGSCSRAPKFDTLILVTPFTASFHPSGRTYFCLATGSPMGFGLFQLTCSNDFLAPAQAGRATTANPSAATSATSATHCIRFMLATPLPWLTDKDEPGRRLVSPPHLLLPRPRWFLARDKENSGSNSLGKSRKTGKW